MTTRPPPATRTERHSNPVSATFAGLRDLLRPQRDIEPLADGERLDGCTAMVTGANSGLGFATAVQLAQRGARVIMACRSGIPDAGDAVRAASGSDLVEMEAVDLSDCASIHALCDRLAARSERLDVVVCNAGVMPRSDRLTSHGLELMFSVNYLAKVVLIRRLLADGVIPRRAIDTDDVAGSERPRIARILFVSSEAHRSAAPLDVGGLGEVVPYGMRDGMAHYSYSKLLLTTFAAELGRRLSDDGGTDVAVHCVCPGAVNSRMAREAPVWVKPLLWPVMRLLFRSPTVAATPVLYLAVSPAVEGQTGRYLHMEARKETREDTRDPANGRALWAATESLLERIGYPAPGEP